MGRQLTMTEARANLASVLDAVEQGEEVTITRHGRPAAVFVRPDMLRTRGASEAFRAACEIREQVEAAGKRPFPHAPKPGITPERAEELIGQIRAERSTR